MFLSFLSRDGKGGYEGVKGMQDGQRKMSAKSEMLTSENRILSNPLAFGLIHLVLLGLT